MEEKGRKKAKASGENGRRNGTTMNETLFQDESIAVTITLDPSKTLRDAGVIVAFRRTETHISNLAVQQLFLTPQSGSFS